MDGLLKGGGDRGDRLTATEALMTVTREHAALRGCLGDVERVSEREWGGIAFVYLQLGVMCTLTVVMDDERGLSSVLGLNLTKSNRECCCCCCL